MNVANRLKTIMQEKHISANSLAKKSSVSQTMISGILRGNKNPTVATLELICSAMNITLADFFTPQNEDSLTLEQKEILSKIKNLSSDKLKALNSVIDTWVD